MPLLSFVVDCQDKAAMAELGESRAQAALEERNKELVTRLIEEFNNGNVEIWPELCVPEFVYYQPSEAAEPMFLEPTIAAFQMIYKSFPDCSWSIHELIAKGNKVVAWTNFTGTDEATYRGIPAAGNKINRGPTARSHANCA